MNHGLWSFIVFKRSLIIRDFSGPNLFWLSIKRWLRSKDGGGRYLLTVSSGWFLVTDFSSFAVPGEA